MLYNLTCERSFHPALLDAGITYTLIDLLGASKLAPTRARAARVAQSSILPAAVGVAAAASPDGSAGTKTTTGKIPVGESDTGEKSNPNGPASSNTAASSTLDAGKGGAGEGSRAEEEEMFDELATQDKMGASGINDVAGTLGGNGGHKGTASKASLCVRRSVLGALMNLTTATLSHPRLDPSAVMTLLTLVVQEDTTER